MNTSDVKKISRESWQQYREHAPIYIIDPLIDLVGTLEARIEEMEKRIAELENEVKAK